MNMDYREEIFTKSEIDWDYDFNVRALNRESRIYEYVSGYFSKVKVVIFENDRNYDESVVQREIMKANEEMGRPEDYDLYEATTLVGYAYILEYEKDTDPEPEEDDRLKYLIDNDGSPYDPATSLISGGLDIRCSFNEEALFAFHTKRSPEDVMDYLIGKGWVQTHDKTYLEFAKGDTRCFFDDWDADEKVFCCFGTEFDEDIKALAELKAKLEAEAEMRKYNVPFLRSQWCDVVVEARNEREALEKAEDIFRNGHDGYIEWEDVDIPRLDEVTGISEV